MTGIAALGAVGLGERCEVIATRECRCLDKGIHALPHLAPDSKSILCLDKVIMALMFVHEEEKGEGCQRREAQH